MIIGTKVPERISRAMRHHLSNRDKIFIASKTGYSVPTVNNLLYGVTNVTEENLKVVNAMIKTARDNARLKLDLCNTDLKILGKI